MLFGIWPLRILGRGSGVSPVKRFCGRASMIVCALDLDISIISSSVARIFVLKLCATYFVFFGCLGVSFDISFPNSFQAGSPPFKTSTFL